MNPKDIIQGNDALNKLSEGANALATAVTATLGPKSRNVGINGYPIPRIIHDGVSIARIVRFKDPFKDMGAMFLKTAAAQTNDIAGDGTTTATLIANTLFQTGLKYVTGQGDGTFASKVNPMTVRDDLLKFTDPILARLEKMSKKIESEEEINQVATISAGNPEIGKIVGEAVNKVGKDGLIMVEKGNSTETTVEYQEGTQFDNGFLSPFFMTDVYRAVAEYDDGYVLLTDFTISDPNDISPLIEKVRKDDNKPLLIIANDIIGAALQTMITSKTRAGYKLIGVVAPEYGDFRREVLEDLATLTGGVVVAKDSGMTLQQAEIKHLGRVRNMRVSYTETILTPANIDKDEIQDRIDIVKNLLKTEGNQHRKTRLEHRLARLSRNAAVITVGGEADFVIDEKRERFIDAVYATKAAMAEGVVSGGGMALMDVLEAFESGEIDKPEGILDESYEIVKAMLKAPFEKLMTNSGFDPAEMYKLIDLLPDSIKNPGIDVTDGRAKDLIVHGIIDPLKVTKSAVKHSLSIAGTMLTTEVLITDYEDPNPVQKVTVV